MDEPFGALDPLTRAEMQDMLRELLERLHKTVLLVTHDLDEALYLASHIVLLEAGKVVANLAARGISRLTNSGGAGLRARCHRGRASEQLMPGFLAQHGSEIAELTLEHLWLTGSAMLLAAAIGVPTGIWLTRHPRWAKPVFGSGEYHPDHSQPGAVRLSFAFALDRRSCRPHRHCRADRVCPAAHRAQYLRRH